MIEYDYSEGELMDGFNDLRYEVLRILQMFTFAATSLATFSNIINNRPLNVIIQPVIATIFILVLLLFQKKSIKYKYISKLVFMTFFNIIYLPIAWIYSPGISSAIGYYAIITIVISVFFVEKKIEFIIPIFSMLFSIFMIRYELANPDYFTPFIDRTTKLNDVSINFAVVTFLLFAIITYINRHYVSEKERFYKQSITDELTGIFNRRYILSNIERLSTITNQDEFSVLFIDVNNFKEINDTYGHHVGDEVLIELGQLLQSNFDICGRFGGDEFIAITSDTKENKIKEVSDSLKSEFEAYAHSYNFNNLSLSIGYTQSGTKSAAEMIKEADQYMYANKHKAFK